MNWWTALAFFAFIVITVLRPFAIVSLAQENSPVYYSAKKITDKLKQPTGIAHAQDDLLFITERAGRIVILQDGRIRRTPFLDLRELVDADASIEQGLLSLAFDPLYAENDYFYITYTDADFTVHLKRYQVSRYPYIALPGSGEALLSIQQSSPLHKGGHLRFGPDRYLYMSVGDGGLSAELDSTGQNKDDLRGKILRLDVSDAMAYKIPPDNPFLDDASYRPEIWLLGFRNPWQFSFAPGSRAMFITDVGWSSIEEINYLSADSLGGGNFGWRIYEGDRLLEQSDPPQIADEAAEEYTFPVFAYPHQKPLRYDGSFPIGCAIIGGHMYRGDALPQLKGQYIYSDYCHGELWTLSRKGNDWQTEKLSETDSHITVVGEDHSGEIYFTNIRGELHKLILAPTSDHDNDKLPNERDNCPDVANKNQADNWGKVGVGDACDEDYYFSKVGGTEVKMFQQHYGAFHIYACDNSGCGLVANLEPRNLSVDAALRIRAEQFAWMVEAALVAESGGQAIYDISVYDDDGIKYVDDLQLLVSGSDLSWRTTR